MVVYFGDDVERRHFEFLLNMVGVEIGAPGRFFNSPIGSECWSQLFTLANLSLLFPGGKGLIG